MSGNTWTWNGTTATAWETNTNWTEIGPGSGDTPDYASGNSFTIVSTGAFTISDISGSDTAGDQAYDLYVNNAGVTLAVDGSGGNFVIGDVLNLNAGVINLSSANGATLELNAAGVGGLVNAFSLGASGTLTDTGGSGLSAFVQADNVTDLTGSGSVIANAGLLQLESGLTVTSGINLIINAGGTLEVDDAMNGANINFTDSTAFLDLTTVVAGTDSVSGMNVGQVGTIEIGNGGASVTSTLSIDGSGNATITAISNSTTEIFNLTGSFASGDMFQSGGTSLTSTSPEFLSLAICFASGTGILTDSGEMPVEAFQDGDTVMTVVNGQRVPQTVTWAGHRTIDLSRHPKPEMVAPIRFRAGSLGENLPLRELVLSPDHCLFIDGGLYPAKLLVNDMTIVQDMDVKTVSYHHIELDRHSVLIAEGVPAESYLDTGNRTYFDNAGLAMVLHPEFTVNESLRCWEEDACAPLMVKPEAVKPVWQRFADRAVALGHTAPVHKTTSDAGIHLTVNGKVVQPVSTQDNTISFMVSAGARTVRLKSRATRPSALTPWLDDPRTLGVAIRSVTLRDQTGESVVNADHPGLRDGWHGAERMADGMFWRWSNGDASLPFVTATACIVEIALSETTTYIEDGQRAAA